jgi:hypothetical protein
MAGGSRCIPVRLGAESVPGREVQRAALWNLLEPTIVVLVALLVGVGIAAALLLAWDGEDTGDRADAVDQRARRAHQLVVAALPDEGHRLGRRADRHTTRATACPDGPVRGSRSRAQTPHRTG